METRIVLPAAIGTAMVLGAAMSTIVPTRMLEAAPPPWANAVERPEPYEPSPTYRFALAPPQDLDPSLEVGPQYRLGEDTMGYSVPAASIDPGDVPTEPVYVAISYGAHDDPQAERAAEPPASDPTPLHPAQLAAIY